MTLLSWQPRDGGIIAEFEVIATFEPRIDTLTARIVGFDELGREVSSQRVPLPVKGIPVGLPTVVRREVGLPPPHGSLGIEVEARPPDGLWNEIPELARFAPDARREARE